MISTVPLCHVDEIPENQSRGFDPQGKGQDTVFLVKRDGQLYAYLDICPHYGDTTLPWKKDAYMETSGHYIVCAAHGAQFDVETGECFSGPCYGQFLTRAPISISADGCVSIELE